MDLMALADALLLPDDDLALATVLKSPLFGLTKTSCSTLAWQRAAARCARRCAQRGEPDAFASAAATRRLRAGRARADAVRLLCPAARRATAAAQRFLARLGLEANDALDEFLNLALDLRKPRDAVAAGLRRLAARRRRPRSSATWRSRATRCA